MRNLLLLLLLANILYFVWEYVREDNPDEPGVAVLEEADLGPPLIVAEQDINQEISRYWWGEKAVEQVVIDHRLGSGHDRPCDAAEHARQDP